MDLLLLSTIGNPELEHALPEVERFLGNRTRIAVLTAAEIELDVREIFTRVRIALARIDATAAHLRWDSPSSHDLLDTHDAILVVGGNTYALLDRLRQSGLFDAIRQRVARGLLYIGTSAGTNITGASIIPTNDWNVVEAAPPFDGMALVPWTVNPHFLDETSPLAPHRDPVSARIREFHAFHAHPVLGLEERTMIIVHGERATVHSVCGSRLRLFAPQQEPTWFASGAELPFRIGTPHADAA